MEIAAISTVHLPDMSNDPYFTVLVSLSNPTLERRRVTKTFLWRSKDLRIGEVMLEHVGENKME